jgi:hypothetical protein
MTHKQVLKKLPLVNNNIIFSFDDDYKVVGGKGGGVFSSSRIETSVEEASHRQ